MLDVVCKPDGDGVSVRYGVDNLNKLGVLYDHANRAASSLPS